ERRRRQAVLVPKVGHRIIRPAEPHRYRAADLPTPDDHLVAPDFGLRVHVLALGAGDGKAPQRPAPGDQPLADVIETKYRLASLEFHVIVDRPRVNDLLPVRCG